MSTYGISFKNPEQQELIRLIQEKDKVIIFADGNAGTGKTFATLCAALDMNTNDKNLEIIYTRNPVQCGEEVGFLPGDVDDKNIPFMLPVLDNLRSIAKKNNKKYGDEKLLLKKIKLEQLMSMRGRTFDNTILIVDEAQNLDLNVMQTLATRIGEYSKIVFLGSGEQIDDKGQLKQKAKYGKCDFETAIDYFADKYYVGVVRLVTSMRSPLCAEIDRTFADLKMEMAKK